METGNDLIDSEHRTLFAAINDLLDACAQGLGRNQVASTVQFLADYVEKHFSDEEGLQRQYDYPHIKPHREFHINYKGKIRALAAELAHSDATIQKLGEINQLTSILIRHIQVEDKRLANYIKTQEEN